MKKLTNEIVRKSFYSEGYIIPDNWEYINNYTKIPYTCPNRHQHQIEFKSWNKGYRCAHCSGLAKLTSKQVRDAFLSEGCTIPEKWEYGNAHKYIPYICTNKHEHLIKWKSWQQGHRCRWCSFAKANLRYYNPEEKIQLYLIRIYDWIHGKETFKYGITRHCVEHRFKKEIEDWGFKVEVIKESSAKAEQICMMEQSLLYEVKGNRTKWVPKSFGGYTECFDLPLNSAIHIWNKIVY